MTLIKTSVLSAISTLIKVVSGFIIVKVVSVYIGPSGLALVAQFQNFIGIASSIATGGIESGIVKYTAEFKEEIETKRKIWSNALKLTFILTFLVSFFTAIFSKYLSLRLLGTIEYSFVFIIFSITLIFFSLNSVLASILNGQGEIKRLTALNIIGSIIGLIVSVLLVIKFHLKGALLAGIFSQSIVFFITLSFVLKRSWFSIQMFSEKLDKDNIIKLLKFSAMMLVASISNMSALIFLRNYIGTNLGWDAAGYWQGVWRISETYLMLITATLSIYYLPKLSSIHNKTELRKEILHGYKVIMPIVITMAVAIYAFRDSIIKIIFTEEFAPMSELFLYQLIGDVFKIASWLLGFNLIAKAKSMIFIIKEISMVILFVFLSILLLSINGLIGITQAFMVLYIINLILIIYIFKIFIWNKM